MHALRSSVKNSLRTTYSRHRHISASAISMGKLIDTIKQDHRDLEDAYNKIINTTDMETKTQWQNQFTWSLARHSISEELVVYPQFEKNLPDGQAMADKDRQEHLTVSILVYICIF
jgi:hemerythrin superfamily protein